MTDMNRDNWTFYSYIEQIINLNEIAKISEAADCITQLRDQLLKEVQIKFPFKCRILARDLGSSYTVFESIMKQTDE